jgi:hypothetical protein
MTGACLLIRRWLEQLVQFVLDGHLKCLQPLLYVYFACAVIPSMRHSKPAAACGSMFYVYQPHVGARAPSSLGGRAPRAAVVGLSTTAPQRSSTDATPAQLRVLIRQTAARLQEIAVSSPDSKLSFSLAGLSCGCRLTIMRG